MAKRSDEIAPVTPEQARLMCHEKAKERGEGYTQADVHREFEARGGKGTLGTLEDWLRQKRPPNAPSLAVLHSVINDRLEAEGFERLLPDILYLLPNPVGTGDGASPKGPDAEIGCLQDRHPEQDIRALPLSA